MSEASIRHLSTGMQRVRSVNVHILVFKVMLLLLFVVIC